VKPIIRRDKKNTYVNVVFFIIVDLLIMLVIDYDDLTEFKVAKSFF